MNDTDTAHCRFCAKPKPYGKLVNLNMDEDRRNEVLQKLFRLSLEVVNFNAAHDALPKTVCFPCIDSLDKAFEFVVNVAASQRKLEGFVLDIDVKQELLLSEDQAFEPYEDNYLEPIVKIEVEISRKLIKNESEKFNITTDNEKKSSEDNSSLHSTLKSEPESSWKDYSWLCAYCDLMFPCINELREHSIKSHGCCNPYRCTDCRIRKLNLDRFVKHVKQHRSHLKLSCYKCHKIFFRQYDVIMHKKDHIGTNFVCPGCNETFASKEQLIEHCTTYNKDKKIRDVPPEHLTDDLSCVFCHKQFRYKGGLTTHLITQHREKKRDHTCDKCGKCFFNKSNLTGHMLMHDDIRPHQCEICNHSFRQRSQLSRHMGIHEGKRPFACEQCGRCFRLKKQLSTHSIVHTDEYPHICSYCHKGFKHKSTFIQHERLHTGERPYKCQVCHREFTNWPNYNKHMKRLHGMNMAKSQQLRGGLLNQIEPDSNAEIKNSVTLMPNINNFVPKRRGRPKIVKTKSQHEVI